MKKRLSAALAAALLLSLLVGGARAAYTLDSGTAVWSMSQDPTGTETVTVQLFSPPMFGIWDGELINPNVYTPQEKTAYLVPAGTVLTLVDAGADSYGAFDTVFCTQFNSQGYPTGEQTIAGSGGYTLTVAADHIYELYTGEAASGAIRPVMSESIYIKGLPKETGGPLAVEGRFTDMQEDAYYAAGVAWAVGRGITTGTGDGSTFSPEDTCTAGEILTFLWRANGSPDPVGAGTGGGLAPGTYYYSAALWAGERGLITLAEFDPEAPCTRSMVVTYLWKLMNRPAAGAAAFTDVDSGADYAPAVAWAVDKGITTGTRDGSTFSPDGACTRGQIATFLYRALG